MLENLIMSAVGSAVHGVVAAVAGKVSKGTKVSMNPVRDSTETLLRVLELKFKE